MIELTWKRTLILLGILTVSVFLLGVSIIGFGIWNHFEKAKDPRNGFLHLWEALRLPPVVDGATIEKISANKNARVHYCAIISFKDQSAASTFCQAIEASSDPMWVSKEIEAYSHPFSEDNIFGGPCANTIFAAFETGSTRAIPRKGNGGVEIYFTTDPDQPLVYIFVEIT